MQFGFWGGTKVWKALKKEFPTLGPRFSHSFIGRHCEEKYFSFAWSGYFPPECQGFRLALHEELTKSWMFWGGNLGARQIFEKNADPLYIIHPTDLSVIPYYQSIGFGGVITSKIEEMPQ